MSTAIPTDDPRRSLTLAQPDNLPHIGLVGDTAVSESLTATIVSLSGRSTLA